MSPLVLDFGFLRVLGFPVESFKTERCVRFHQLGMMARLEALAPKKFRNLSHLCRNPNPCADTAR